MLSELLGEGLEDMLRFFSHLFKLNYEECKACDILKKQLELERAENKRLLDTILGLVTPVVHEVPKADIKIEPIVPKIVPWRIKQRELERASRERAQEMRDNKLNNPEVAGDIEALEKELEVDNNAS